MLTTRSGRMAYFEPWLGPLSPAHPVLGGFEAFTGRYRGQPVWLVWTEGTSGSKSLASLWLAMRVGHPIEGSIATDDVLRNRPPVSDAEFFGVFHVSISPDGVAPRARVDELDAGARAAYEAFLRARRDAGEWPAGPTVEAGARYLSEQIALAMTQRASGQDSDTIRDMLSLALSVFMRP